MSTMLRSKPRHTFHYIYIYIYIFLFIFLKREREGRDVRLAWHMAPPTGPELEEMCFCLRLFVFPPRSHHQPVMKLKKRAENTPERRVTFSFQKLASPCTRNHVSCTPLFIYSLSSKIVGLIFAFFFFLIRAQLPASVTEISTATRAMLLLQNPAAFSVAAWRERTVNCRTSPRSTR